VLYIWILSNKFDLKQTIRVLHSIMTIDGEFRYNDRRLHYCYAECRSANCRAADSNSGICYFLRLIRSNVFTTFKLEVGAPVSM